jgi:hypothetical protein
MYNIAFIYMYEITLLLIPLKYFCHYWHNLAAAAAAAASDTPTAETLLKNAHVHKSIIQLFISLG